MKKKYNKPTMWIVNIQHKSSILVGSEVKSVDGNASLEWGGGGTEAARTRENNVWDEEW